MSALSKREVIRRLRTSAAQFYRLLDQINYRKSVDPLAQTAASQVRHHPAQALARPARQSLGGFEDVGGRGSAWSAWIR